MQRRLPPGASALPAGAGQLRAAAPSGPHAGRPLPTGDGLHVPRGTPGDSERLTDTDVRPGLGEIPAGHPAGHRAA